MSHLYLPWGSGERYTNRLQVRNQFASSLELHKQSSYEYQEPIYRQRSPSLPPIHNIDINRSLEDNKRQKEVLNRNVSSAKRFAFYDEDAEGDTSGYGSETINHMNIRNQCTKFHEAANYSNPVVAWQQEEKEKRKQPSSGRSGMTGGLSARSTSGQDEGRPRWGDRGVATGRLWEPTAPNERLPQMQNQKKGTPSWVERGLNMIDNASDVLMIDQRSSNSVLDYDHSSNGSDEGRTFLRGQNVPIEPEIKAQRETKRIKALELQSAILSQLEEREKRRQEDRERKLREERIEELRIQRQQEEDRLRLEEEKRKCKEKKLLEQRKLDALKRALEDAERKARQEKEKRLSCHRQATLFSGNDCTEKVVEDASCENKQLSPAKSCSPTKTCSPTKSHRTYNVQSSTSLNKENSSQQTTAFNSPRSINASNLNLFIHNVPPHALTDNQYNIVPIGITNNAEILNNQSNNIQLAVLVPQNKNVYSMSLNSINNLHDICEMEKILTPSKYRSIKTKDAYTQTDVNIPNKTPERAEHDVRSIDKNYSNIDENAPNDEHRNVSKKDRRLRSEERYKKDIESRPKWGANKPVAQYKKQSEKDPFYTQKRKVRQKYRPQVRQYMSQSSEDSRSPSPPTRSDNTMESSIKKRNSLSQSYWRNKRSSQDFTQFQNQINNPEFTSLAQITEDNKVENKKSPKISAARRLTLSQKFINDKYGSRKLWIDDTNDRASKYSLSDLDNPKRISDKTNMIKRDVNEISQIQDDVLSNIKL